MPPVLEFWPDYGAGEDLDPSAEGSVRVWQTLQFGAAVAEVGEAFERDLADITVGVDGQPVLTRSTRNVGPLEVAMLHGVGLVGTQLQTRRNCGVDGSYGQWMTRSCRHGGRRGRPLPGAV